MWPFSWLARIRRSRHRKACREQERFERLLERQINWGATGVAPRGRQRQEARFSSELEACQRVYVDDGSSDMSTPEKIVLDTNTKV